ncbi:uncharacterized protein KGF55_003082 [Candida pseudojiufengensis]|uniref:uncharacterized protein n=1 Tax=Candida pseudojiufengensis TaxID=497109 RepID=UPI0022254E0D|nr:uncharacterized protein KGF55_003082 [Candida pseudojiufengensis]KAI5963290.1 hypothetical protein KGF55_003082 [Candida pseudojiufengensis]
MTKNQRPIPKGRRSSSYDRRMIRSRTNSVTSMDSSVSHLLEDNNNEMFSGAASEVIPSSITSLHYPHNFGNRRGSRISRETSPLLSADEDLVDLRSVKSNASRSSNDTQAHFKFFSPDEIEMAQGGSTLENPDDPVDYNTPWDYSIDKYEEPEEALIDDELGYQRSTESPEYGSTDYEPRARRESDESSNKSIEDEDREDASKIDEDFQRQFPTKNYYQRYYLAEEDLVIGIAGYRDNWFKKILYYVLCVSTLGLAFIVLRWFPKYRINIMGTKCALGVADWCVIENEFGELQIQEITSKRFDEKLSDFLINSESESDVEKDPVVPNIHFFIYRYIKFFYDPVEDIFRTNSNWYDSRWLNIKNIKDGISQGTYEERIKIFQENSIEIKEKSIAQLLADEILHPFYIFQVFSIFLWLADDYYYYASCIFIISMVSIINSLVETKATIRRLQQISKFECEVRVWRNEFWKQIDSTDLVPGDIFEIDPSLATIPCDSLLVNGECVINESMLTGESVPVSKIQATKDVLKLLPENFIDPKLSKSYLFNGTKLLKMKSGNDEPVTAMVLKTGFNTTKGSLVRSMLFPKPTGFKFYEDSFKYIAFMTGIAFIGFMYSTYNFIKIGLSKKVMILRALDIITIVVPPALPATLTIGTTFAIARLKKHQLFCIAPTRVNIAGKIDVMCFDKTGTLTEDGLDVLGIHLANNASGRKEIVFEELITNIKNLKTIRSSDHETNNGKFLLGCMAACHSLRNIDEELMGDPLDVKMFEFTKWEYNEDLNTGIPIVSNQNEKYKIEKEYEFSAPLRRMSVFVKHNNKGFIFTKGAPEIMMDICIPESIPSNFEELLHHYTTSGFRVIACAYKQTADNSLERQEAESELTFTGFIVFENKLKDSTAATLEVLSSAKIRTVMCTGDNILTAISVAKESKLLTSDIKNVYIPSLEYKEDDQRQLTWQDVNDPENKLDPDTIKPLDIRQSSNYKLAITGDIFRFLLTELKDANIIQSVLMQCDIFARMSPDEKHELVEQFQKIDYTVGFCGDGANDCGALKAADVGISLSEAEASVAAPFTSRIFEISCVPTIIKEGRSSLVTSFSCFKYMSLYSAIQFISVTILYKTGTNLGDFQFLYIDLFLILPLAIFMSWSKPYDKLVIKRPTANLVSPKVLIPLVCSILVLLIFQVIIWSWVKKEPWYIKPIPGSDDAVKSSDNTVLFLFSNFQYILIAVVLNQGPPFREPIEKNLPFLINLVVATLLSISLFAINGDSSMGDLLQLTNLSRAFYWYILLFSVVNLVVLIFGDKNWFIKLATVYKKIFQRHKIGKSKKLFKNLRKEFSKIQSV